MNVDIKLTLSENIQKWLKIAASSLCPKIVFGYTVEAVITYFCNKQGYYKRILEQTPSCRGSGRNLKGL